MEGSEEYIEESLPSGKSSDKSERLNQVTIKKNSDQPYYNSLTKRKS